MRSWITTLLGLALGVGAGCSDKDGAAEGTGTGAGDDGGDTKTCLIGTLNCSCSHGGSCITGLMCENEICVPAPDTGDGGSGDGGGGTESTTGPVGTGSGTGTGTGTGTGGTGTGSGSTGSTSMPAGTTMVFTTIEDTFVQGSSEDFNTGMNTTLSVHWTPHIALVGFDVAAIDAFVAGGNVLAAELRLAISGVGAGWGPSGNDIAAYRMNVHWTEDGATYNCAIDTGHNNMVTDCSGPTAWDMDGPTFPYVTTPSDSATITEGLTGTIAFDVTADVQAFAGGAANEGWAIRKVDDGQLGGLSFHSREGTIPPVLSITIE